MKIIIKHQYVMNYIAFNVYKIRYYFLHTHAQFQRIYIFLKNM